MFQNVITRLEDGKEAVVRAVCRNFPDQTNKNPNDFFQEISIGYTLDGIMNNNNNPIARLLGGIVKVVSR